jgi:hypothetical protein
VPLTATGPVRICCSQARRGEAEEFHRELESYDTLLNFLGDDEAVLFVRTPTSFRVRTAAAHPITPMALRLVNPTSFRPARFARAHRPSHRIEKLRRPAIPPQQLAITVDRRFADRCPAFSGSAKVKKLVRDRWLPE